MDTTQTGVNLIEGDDELAMDKIQTKYGLLAIIQYVEDALDDEKDTARIIHEDAEEGRKYMKAANQVRRLMISLQALGIEN